MKMTGKEYAELISRKPSLRPVEDNRDRPSHCFQESKAGHPGQVNRKDADADRASRKKVDAESSGPVRVSITYLVSDKRRRDCWGMAETIADCLVEASRRLLDSNAAGSAERQDG